MAFIHPKFIQTSLVSMNEKRRRRERRQAWLPIHVPRDRPPGLSALAELREKLAEEIEADRERELRAMARERGLIPSERERS